jgi:hypothetical protein
MLWQINAQAALKDGLAGRIPVKLDRALASQVGVRVTSPLFNTTRICEASQSMLHWIRILSPVRALQDGAGAVQGAIDSGVDGSPEGTSSHARDRCLHEVDW